MACRRGPKCCKLFDLGASIGVILGEYLVYGSYVGIMEKNMEISRMGYIRFRGLQVGLWTRLVPDTGQWFSDHFSCGGCG